MFRPWYPPAQRDSFSRHTGQRVGSSRGTRPRTEDAQPNEFVNKRQRRPPAITSVVPNQTPRRGGSRGTSRPSAACRDKPFTTWDPSSRCMRRPPPPPQQSSGSVDLCPGKSPLATTGGGPKRATSPNASIDATPRLDNFVSTSMLDAPPAKRRKQESPEIKREPPTAETATLTVTSSVSPVSSVTLVGDHKVKRERSTSPELSTESQAITAGVKRYAPLPLACKKTQPNYKAARNAWAKKEQEALKRLGLRAVRTFIREDGMVIDWEVIDCQQPVDTAAAIERALLLNDAAIQIPPRQRVKPSTQNRNRVVGQDRTPSAAEIVHQVTLRGGHRPAPARQSGSRACVEQASDPCGPGPSQQQEDFAHTSAGCLNVQATMESPARDAPSDHSRLSIHRKATSDVSIFLPSRACTKSSNPQVPSTSSEFQTRTTSPQLSLPLPSPSQRATLRHILQLRQRVSPELLKPPANSSSPSSTSRKLCPSPKLSQTENPSRQSTESPADVVAAAINESARLDRSGSSNTPAPSTPLRLYKKPLSPSPAARGIEQSTTPPSEARRQARRSSSSRRYSSPPIAVLTSASVGSSSESLKADLASSSTCGEEYDELELSYPPSPMQPPQEVHLEPHPPAILPTTSQVFVGPAAEPASQPPLLNTEPPPPGEHAVMRSAALQYLERYFQTFDTDPHALAEAYAPDAVFSCSSRNLCAQGRDGILDALRRLDFGALCSGDKIEYDVTYLGSGIGVLLVVLGTFSGVQDHNRVGYTMSFVLRSVREDPVSSAGVSWPMVAGVHQMVLR